MNTFIQNSLVIIAGLLALFFLIKKFFFKKSKSKDNCDDGCGCH